jgi:hypothetical protein
MPSPKLTSPPYNDKTLPRASQVQRQLKVTHTKPVSSSFVRSPRKHTQQEVQQENRNSQLTRLRPHPPRDLHMRPIVLLPELHLPVPLQRAIPPFTKRDHALFFLPGPLGELSKPCRLDRVQPADVVEEAFGLAQAGVVDELGGGEEGGGVGFSDGELGVEDEG